MVLKALPVFEFYLAEEGRKSMEKLSWEALRVLGPEVSTSLCTHAIGSVLSPTSTSNWNGGLGNHACARKKMNLVW